MPLTFKIRGSDVISTRNQQSGVALFEILIALFVLSIGMLGFAGLQSVGMKNGHSAFLKTEATFLAMDIMERMRANPDGVAGGDFEINTVNATYNPPGCTFLTCNAAQRPALDASEWEGALTARLPGGEGIVAETVTPGLFLVTVMWDDERRGATGAASKDCGGDRGNDLTCFQMLFQPQS